jgi:hypothetical protein
MGRRSRKRSTGTAPDARTPAPGPPRPPVRTPSRRARREEAPPAPWGSFPLVELCILIGLVVLVVGFFSGGKRGESLVLAGLALVSLASLELAIREHFAGYRSHSSLLAMAAAFGVGALLWVTGLVDSRPVVLVVAAVTAMAAFFALRTAFARRAGGLTFRA